MIVAVHFSDAEELGVIYILNYNHLYYYSFKAKVCPP